MQSELPQQLRNLITVDMIGSFPVPNLNDHTSWYTALFLLHLKWYVKNHDYFKRAKKSLVDAMPDCFCKFIEYWSIRVQGGKLRENSVFMKTMNNPFAATITRALQCVQQIFSGESKFT